MRSTRYAAALQVAARYAASKQFADQHPDGKPVHRVPRRRSRHYWRHQDAS